VDGTFTGAVSLDMKASKDDAKKAWNKYIQDEHNVDIKGYGFFKKKDKLTTDPISMSFLSDEKLKLHTAFKGDDQYTIMDIYVLRPDGTSLSMDRDEKIINNLETLTEEFVAGFLPDYYEERVDNAKEEYDDSLDALAEINDDIGAKSRKIIELQEEIANLKREKITATQKVDSKKNSLAKKNIVLDKVKKKTNNLN